ncbi:TPA: hypothetical protein NO892_005351 [Klebsiella variicola subsp. variicola]|nr:hypothetical protein [Klebsiella variicola subsp. variicola]
MKEHFLLRTKRGIFMSEIRELSLNEIAMVSGGEGHGLEVNRDRQDAKNAARGRSGGSWSAPVTTANNAGIGIIAGTIGAIVGLAGGPVGVVAAGAVLGGLGASMPTSSSSSNRNSGGGWHDSNPGSVAGQCRW